MTFSLLLAYLVIEPIYCRPVPLHCRLLVFVDRTVSGQPPTGRFSFVFPFECSTKKQTVFVVKLTVFGIASQSYQFKGEEMEESSSHQQRARRSGRSSTVEQGTLYAFHARLPAAGVFAYGSELL